MGEHVVCSFSCMKAMRNIVLIVCAVPREVELSSLHHFQLSGSELRQMRMQNSVAEMNWCHSWTCSSSPLLFAD